MILPDALIREAELADARGVIEVVRTSLSEPDHDQTNSLEEYNPTEDDERRFIQKIMDDENSLMLVAESISGSRIIGVLTCIGKSRPALKHSADLDITIAVDWRGKGIGTRMIEEALRWANRSDVLRRVQLEVMVRNRGAVSLYAKLGFQVEGRGIGYIRKGDSYHDVYWMAIPVAEIEPPQADEMVAELDVDVSVIAGTERATDPVKPRPLDLPGKETETSELPAKPDPETETTEQPARTETQTSETPVKPADEPVKQPAKTEATTHNEQTMPEVTAEESPAKPSGSDNGHDPSSTDTA